MFHLRRTSLAVVAAYVAACVMGVASCGGSGGGSGTPEEDASVGPPDSGQAPDGTAMGPDGAPPPPVDGALPPVDANPPPNGWDGGFAGPLTCPSMGNYVMNGNMCGTERWPVKTGADSGANSVSLLPTLTTIPALTAIPTPNLTNPPYSTRIDSAEKTVWALKDVRVVYTRLETDSDYHIVINDQYGHSMITEVPYPNCVYSGPWKCNISRARAAVDAEFPGLVMGVGKGQNAFASIIGVGFWDPEHGQYGVAPNNLELHAVLAICFGLGCDPTK
jgi:hypothetical protein